jgi:hypothetical protein
VFNPLLLYIVSIVLSILVVVGNERSAASLRDDFDKLDIHGSYLDRDLHQINFFIWTGTNQIKRKSQGIATTETWTIDPARDRYMINAGAGSTRANYAERSGDVIIIKNPVGAILKRLYKVTPFICTSCKDADRNHPTYSNFSRDYHLVKVTDKTQFIADLDQLRACAIYNFQTIPIGKDSNKLLSEAPFAVAKDNSCFYYVPPTQFGVLQSNGVPLTQIAYQTLPRAFCGAM